jgi:hypothetical protein
MKVVKIRIGGRMFILDPEQNLDVLRDDIVAAASSGAGFVSFETAGHITVSALVTPYLPVRISEIETTAEQAAASDQAGPIAEDPPFAVGAHFDG